LKPQASILIATRNQPETIQQAIESALKQEGYRTEVLVLDDRSRAEVLELYKRFEKKIKILNSGSKGRVKLLNYGIGKSRADFVCVSAGDCILEKGFLRKILRLFGQDKNGKLAFVSPFSETGGNCTVFRKKVLEEMQGFSNDFNDGKTGFRDDTDLAFRIWDKGYKSVFTYEPKFQHEHKSPEGLGKKLAYAWTRVKIHRFDALLFKKHSERAAMFFDVKFGFLRNPLKDFETAAGLWWKGKTKKAFALSSPQGVTLIEGKTIVHQIAIIMAAALYVALVKMVRLYSSLRFGKLLL